MNVISFVINMTVGVLLVPYLVRSLGIVAYGLVPLAMVFTEYINVINVSINGAITRFITIDIQNGDWLAANKTFNTAFWGLLFLITLQGPILFGITISISKILVFPEVLLADGYWLFGFTFCGYLISLLSSVFNTSMYANNRLDLSRSVDIIRIVVRVIAIIFFFNFFSISLKFVGIATFLSAICEFCFSFYNWRKITPNLKIRLSYFEFNKLKNLFSMGGWLIINQLGYLLFLKIDLFIINRNLGPELVGKYSAVQQWNSLIRTFAGVLSGIFGPVILISNANNLKSEVIKYCQIGVRYLTMFLGIVCGIVCGFSSNILSIWLGPEYSNLNVLMITMILPLTINVGVMPLFPLNNALNKVKIPGIVTLVLGAINFVVALIFLKLNYGLIGVAGAGALVLTLKNFVFTPVYASHILEISLKTFYRPLKSGCMLLFISFLSSSLIANFIKIENIIDLGIAIFIITIGCLLICWLAILDHTEKSYIVSSVREKL